MLDIVNAQKLQLKMLSTFPQYGTCKIKNAQDSKKMKKLRVKFTL